MNEVSESSTTEEKSRFTAEEVTQARSLLIHSVFDHRNDNRLRRREVVRQIMGALTAARQAGYGWEEIAEILATGGVILKANTLRQYFFDLREEATADDHKEAKTYIKTRRELVGEQRRTEQEELTRRVRRQRPASSSSPTLRHQQSSHPPELSDHAAPRPASPGPVSLLDPKKPGLGPLLSELEAQASRVKDPAVLPNDVLLSPDGRVYFSTGEPFNLLLNSRQINLLRSAKTLVASTGSSRTASQFVKLQQI